MGILNSRYSDQLITKLICFSISYQLGVSIVRSGPQFSQAAESLIHVTGGELVNALADNLLYFDGYAKGMNSGLMGEFLTSNKINYLTNKLQKM